MRLIQIERTDCSMPNDANDYPFILNVDAIAGYRPCEFLGGDIPKGGKFTGDVMIFAPIPTKFGMAIRVTREKWQEIMSMIAIIEI